MSVEEYDIQNLNCASCSTKIEAEILALPEVSSVNLDFLNRKLVVQYHSAIDNPLQRLNRIATSIEPGVVFTEKTAEYAEPGAAWRWISLASGALILILNHWLPSYLQPWIGVGAYLLVAHRVLLNAGMSLLAKQLFTEQFLMSIATIGALILGEYLEAGAVMVLYEIGQWLEHRAIDLSRSSVKNLLAVKPEMAHLHTAEGIEDKRLAEIKAGDTISVYPGERVPLDGLISKGESTVDTSSLTGEAEPLFVTEGTEIFSGFVNNSGLLELKVSGTEAESTITRILNLIEEAGTRKAPQEKFITRFARVYTPAVVFIALLVFLIPTLLGHPAAVWFKRSLVFLIVSCPCALVISIPLSYFIGIGIAAKRGIILKGSVFLDVLRKVRTIVFDKTGTLTSGDLQIEKVYTQNGGDPLELLETLYLCEYTSSHPFARAVKSAFDGLYDSRQVKALAEYPGKGIVLEYGADRLIAGSEAFLRDHGHVGLLSPSAQSVVHAVKNDAYLGCVSFSDTLKPGIKPALASLKQLGVRSTVMLSGDRAAKAEQVSRELGLDTFYAELLPQQKLAKLEEIIQSAEGKVAFVGDGMNDAPALARADVGIAMGGIGNQASIETADIVLLNDRPEQLAGVFQIARQTGKVVVQNIALALGIKMLVMALGVSGISGLWEAIIADVGVTLLVVFNSLRMLRVPRPT